MVNRNKIDLRDLGMLSAETITLMSGMTVLTVLSAYTDTRWRIIPNWLTVPVFVAGLVFQFWFHGWTGLGEGMQAFAVGFGTFFVLWLIGGGGAGDVKLFGALSVWLGVRPTLWTMILSVIIHLFRTFVIRGYTIVTRGKKYLKTAEFAAEGKEKNDSGQTNRENAPARTARTFAWPVAVAVWIVILALKLPR